MQKPNVYLFPQLDDNYGYLIKNPHETKGVLVDPSDLDMCLKILELNDCSASHIIITHHHDDHISAVDEIKSRFKSLVIGYKNDSKIPKPDKEVEDQEIFEIHGNEYKVIHTPGHTLQHINYFMLKHNILFSGDTGVSDNLMNYGEKLDILVHEVYSSETFKNKTDDWQIYHNAHHTSSIDLGIIANKLKPKKLVLSHILFWGATEESLLDDVKSNFDGNAIIAKDLMVIR